MRKLGDASQAAFRPLPWLAGKKFHSEKIIHNLRDFFSRM
jgi:hypothetical protein